MKRCACWQVGPRSVAGRAKLQALQQRRKVERLREMAGTDVPHVSPLPRTRRQMASEALTKKGSTVAQAAKTLSDSEWEGVSLEDKRAFYAYMGRQLKEDPLSVSDQQRRRYFEGTLARPERYDANETVTDTYTRVKMGLPTAIHPQQQLGVTQAIYEAAEAELFDPDEAHKIENAMTHVKQLFCDYVQKKRQGLSTEAERRRLATVSAELNLQTQRHLANMFKFAEKRLRDAMMEDRQRALLHLRRVQDPSHKTKPRSMTIRRRLRRAFGVDPAVTAMVLRELRAKENFLRKAEVLSRLTVGRGFCHGPGDETVGDYTARLASAAEFSQIDAVQAEAAAEGVPPVEWARRWFEAAVVVPLRHTAEYAELQRLAALTTQPNENDRKWGEAGEAQRQRVESLAERMFLKPDDERLKTLHEKRLRYVAHAHIESLVKKMRENAKLFEGVESSEEAATCRELYDLLQVRKVALIEQHGPDYNVFEDEQARTLFKEIETIAEKVIRERTPIGEAERKAARLRQVVAAIKGDEEEIRQMLAARKKQLLDRILRLMERDVREDIVWLEALQESDRPPLLPIPQPMSYISVADVAALKEIRERQEKQKGNPFEAKKRVMPSLLGQEWPCPNKPLLFWGTGVAAVRQALDLEARDAKRKRDGIPLPPPHPCAENPWGWRVRPDPLNDEG